MILLMKALCGSMSVLCSGVLCVVTLVLLKSLSFVREIEHELMLFHDADSPLIKLDFVKENSGNHLQFFNHQVQNFLIFAM